MMNNMQTAELMDRPKAVTDNANTRMTARRERAGEIIKNYSLYAAGAGMVPVIGVDTAAVTFVNYKLVEELANIYEVPFQQEQSKIIISSLVTSLAGTLVSKLLTSISGPFSLFGFVSGAITNAAVSSFLTFSSGEILRLHFAEGGTLENIDVNHYIDYYTDQVKQGNITPRKFASLNAFSHMFGK